jgi:hypothetical protein
MMISGVGVVFQTGEIMQADSWKKPPQISGDAIRQKIPAKKFSFFD